MTLMKRSLQLLQGLKPEDSCFWKNKKKNKVYENKCKEKNAKKDKLWKFLKDMTSFFCNE